MKFYNVKSIWRFMLKFEQHKHTAPLQYSRSVPLGVRTTTDIRLRLLWETGAGWVSQHIISLYYRVITELGMIFTGELPGKLQHIQQLVAHLLPPLKRAINYQLLTFQNAAFSSNRHLCTHSINYDWIWGPCSENKAQSFGPFDQRSLVWWGSLENDLVILPLRDHRVAHRHHCQELADLRRRRLKDAQN